MGGKYQHWLKERAQATKSTHWLTGLFFFESFCFPFPVDPLLLYVCSNNKARAFDFATRATLASVLGGLAGYGIGALLWEHWGVWLSSVVLNPNTLAHAQNLLREHERLAVLIAAFTPIPYKAVTLSAGFCGLALIPFVMFSMLGRGTRFFLVAACAKHVPGKMSFLVDHLDRHLILCILVIGGICLWLTW